MSELAARAISANTKESGNGSGVKRTAAITSDTTRLLEAIEAWDEQALLLFFNDISSVKRCTQRSSARFLPEIRRPPREKSES